MQEIVSRETFYNACIFYRPVALSEFHTRYDKFILYKNSILL